MNDLVLLPAAHRLQLTFEQRMALGRYLVPIRVKPRMLLAGIEQCGECKFAWATRLCPQSPKPALGFAFIS